MNLYYDSEFTGLHQTSSLISIAFVADDGNEFYAEFSDYQQAQCDDWIQKNVLDHSRWLQADTQTGCWKEGELTCSFGDSQHNRATLTTWLAQYDTIEIWADCLAWDWVLFCQLYGGAFQIPQQIFYMPFDLVTLFKACHEDPNTDRLIFSRLSEKTSSTEQPHNALYDAKVLQACYHRLMNGE